MTKPTPILCVFLWLLCFPAWGASQILSDSQLANISFEQKLNAQVPLKLAFRDENNQRVRLGDYFGQKPVILVLGYYGCPMLCTLVLNGLTESMQELKWSIGTEFQVINVSIAANETPTLAAAKKKAYLRRYGRLGAPDGWHFLTGDAASTRQLADIVGFQFAYDNSSRQYAHPSGLVILTPDGKVSKYLFGVTYSPRDLFAALDAARTRSIGSRIQELVLLCFHYRPITGKYGASVMLLVRICAVATLGLLAVLIIRSSTAAGRSGRASPSSLANEAVKSTPGA